MTKHKLSKEQITSLISTLYFELQTVFGVSSFLKDKESNKLSKQILKNIETLVKRSGSTLGKDSTLYSISE